MSRNLQWDDEPLPTCHEEINFKKVETKELLLDPRLLPYWIYKVACKGFVRKYAAKSGVCMLANIHIKLNGILKNKPVASIC